MATLKLSSKTPKSIDEWTSRDFLVHFLDKYALLTKTPFKMPPEAWLPMMSRIKQFRVKNKVSNIDYLRFINDIFEKFFTRDGYVPAFGAIVSVKVLGVIALYQTAQTAPPCVIAQLSNDEFTKLQAEVYSDNSLFGKFK